ncbi:MXAN_6652 family MXYO-CTERM-anchored protein [Stigmatella erecta]|uniref:Myxococcales GC_trans_RRR domain-containing protein n=1 Tax=Stigmatella erecta TaxID=83460 RepID=A0A1I0HUI0_9BACT|nr:MXAN_6652 family MXYO-CTERM-anchored protein [Stigmatella erecta]SET87903.1 Myxococcales GC_trans_RRR domain-containing protein [Stigmatella erecta]
MSFSSLRAVGMWSLFLLSTPVLANSTGITGQSGKQNSTCVTCHVDGTAGATVTISGPAALAAGETGQYRLIIRGGPAVVGGYNVAVSNTAAMLQAGEGSRKAGDELTHSAPKAFVAGEVSFDFSLVAPSTPSTLTLYGAGNSANGDKNSTQDRSVASTFTVTVAGGTGTPDAGTPDAGTPDAGTPDAGTGEEPGDDDDDEGGCSAGGGTAVLSFAVTAAGLLLSRRRRR